MEDLHEGDVFIRDGDRNRPATREDYQKFTQFHVEKERDYVTQGLRQMVGLDIDYLRDLGRIEEVDETDEEAVMPVRIDEEEGLEIQPSLRSPLDVSSLARELNADITKWRRRPNFSCSLEELYDYYSASETLDPNEEKLAFLTQSAWRHGHLGAYWVSQMSDNQVFLEMCRRISMDSFEGGNALHLGKFFAVTFPEKIVEAFIGSIGLNTNYHNGYGSILLRSAKESEPSEVLASTGMRYAEYIDSSSWNLKEMEFEGLSTVVQKVSSELERIATDHPGVTPSGLKGWLRNAEIYIGHQYVKFPPEVEDKLLEILEE